MNVLGPKHETVDLEVNCPRCGYSMRGVRGSFATCPECGLACQIPQIISQRYQDWFEHPDYRAMAAPALTASIGIVIIALIMIATTYAQQGVLVPMGVMVLTIVWVLLVAVAIIKCGGELRVWGMLAMLHVVYIGFTIFVLGGIVDFFVHLVRVAQALSNQQPSRAMGSGVWALAAIVVAMVSFFMLRRAHHRIGARCANWLLIRDSATY